MLQQDWARLFNNNHETFYQDLDIEITGEQTAPDADEAKEFWSSIWSDSTEHRRDAEWLQRIRQQGNTDGHRDIKINRKNLRTICCPTGKPQAPI